MTKRTSLQELVRRSTPPSTTPPLLPASHVSRASFFRGLCESGEVKPHLCPHFGEELVYLFYGGLFYRPSYDQSEDSDEFPVAFVFHPGIYSHALRFFPFDTGALFAGAFGPKWTPVLKGRLEYVQAGSGQATPRRMVYHLYRTNTQYAFGRPDPTAAASKLTELVTFLNEDLSGDGVDDRQYRIECQLRETVRLKDFLIWVAYPLPLEGVFAPLYDTLLPNPPTFHAYVPNRRHTAAEWVHTLNQLAQEQVFLRFSNPPRADR